MKVFCTLIILSIIFACGISKSTAKNEIVTILDFKDQFAYKNLDTFIEDSLDWQVPEQFVQIDSSMYSIIWKNGEFKPNEMNADYFYSWQEVDEDKLKCTILTLDESDYCVKITYHIFKKDGTFISSFLASAFCADGGWVYTASGRFNKQKKYQLTSCEKMYNPDSEIKRTIIEGDSVWKQTKILKDGSIKTNIIKSKSFSYSEPF